MKMARMSVLVLACMALFLGSFYTADAKSTEKGDVSELFILHSINSEYSSVDFGISSNVASSSCKVRGKGGTSRIEITISLQKKRSKSNDWTTIKSWSASSKSFSLTMEKSYQLTSKGTYRCYMKSTVVIDGMSEISYQASESKVYK